MARTTYALLVFMLLLPGSALAADQMVTARSESFDPRNVTIDPGDRVTWNSPPGGFHNVKFEDGSFEEPAEPTFAAFSVSRTFDTPGTYRYYCEAHGAPGGVGMAGTVAVTGAAPGPTSDTTAPAISDLEANPARFCNRRGCRPRRTRFEFELTESATVKGRIRPRGRPRGRRGTRFEREADAGENRIRFSGRRLRPGRYRLILIATDAAGNESERARTGFRITRPR